MQQIDTDADNTGFPAVLIAAIRSNVLDAFRVNDSSGDDGADDSKVRTETQLYELLLIDAGRTEKYSITESAVNENASIKSLIDGIWKNAKPIP